MWYLVWLTPVMVTGLEAQDKKEPPRREFVMPADSATHREEESLPKFDLPEFLITGKESVELPAVAKTAAEGEWSDVSSPRESGPGSREMSPLRLSEARRDLLRLSPVMEGYNGKVQVGYGSFRTPYFESWFGGSSPTEDFLLKAGYKSSGGHVAHADNRMGHASLSGGTQLPGNFGPLSGSRLRARMGMEGKGFRLYGSQNPSLQRTVTKFDAGFSLNSSSDAPVAYAATAALESGTLKDASSTTETSLGVDLHVTKPAGDIELRGEVALWRSFYTAPSSTVDPFFTRFGAAAKYRLVNKVDLRGGLAFFLFRGSEMKTLGRLYPHLGVSWYAEEWLTVYAKYEPSVQRTSLSGLVDSSPYVVTDLPLRHPEQFLDFSLGAEAELAWRTRARISLDYTRTDNTPVFVDPAARGVWEVSYMGTTRIVSVNAELNTDITDADNFGASLSARGNKNSATGQRNPYFPALMSSATYRHRFPFGLVTGAGVQVVGRRSTDPTNSRHLPALAILNLNAEYVILQGWNVSMVLHNVFDKGLTWWDNYPGIPRTVSFATGFAW
jgi:hypothetical protein